MSRPKIAITQRLDLVQGRDEYRDALDVRLSALLWDLGFAPYPLVSSIDTKESYIGNLSPDGFILSGGNNINPDSQRDHLEEAVLKYSMAFDLPVLGICRGMQYINFFQGGCLQEVPGHTGVLHSIHGTGIIKGHVNVNSFHDYGIKNGGLGHDLEVLAKTDDGVIESFKHIKHRWLGIMWHPERNKLITKADQILIKTHLSGTNK